MYSDKSSLIGEFKGKQDKANNNKELEASQRSSRSKQIFWLKEENKLLRQLKKDHPKAHWKVIIQTINDIHKCNRTEKSCKRH